MRLSPCTALEPPMVNIQGKSFMLCYLRCSQPRGNTYVLPVKNIFLFACHHFI